MKKLLSAFMILIFSSGMAMSYEIYMEPKDVNDGIEDYDSVAYIASKSTRHYREAWDQEFNEDMYIDQCITALAFQADRNDANGVVNMSWYIEPEIPENWYTVVCQGLAVWKY